MLEIFVVLSALGGFALGALISFTRQASKPRAYGHIDERDPPTYPAISAFFFWSPSWAERGVKNLFKRFYLNREDSYAVFRSKLDPEEGAQLDQAIRELRFSNKPFDIRLTQNASYLRAIGEANDGVPIVIVINDSTLAPTGLAPTGPAPTGLAPTGPAPTGPASDGHRAAEHQKALVNQHHLTHLLNLLPIPVWLTDSNHDLLYWNQAFSQAVPHSSHHRQSRYFSPAVRDLTTRALHYNSLQTESMHIVIDGRRRLMECASTPYPDKTPESPQTAGYALDLTDLEKAQQEISRHIDAHASVLEGMSTAIEIYDADQRLQFFNEAFVSMSGIEREKLTQQPSMTEVLEMMRARRRLPETDDFPGFKKQRLALFQRNESSPKDWLFLPDETTWSFKAAPHPSGGVILSYEDVTDRLLLERSFNVLINVQRTSLDHLGQAVAVFRQDGRLAIYNRAFGELWCLPPILLVAHPHVNEIAQSTRHLLQDKEQGAAYESWLIDCVINPKAETGRWQRCDDITVQYGSVPLPDGGVMITFTDITQENQRFRELHDCLWNHAQGQKMRYALDSIFGHGLAFSLRMLVGQIDILLNGQEESSSHSLTHRLLDRGHAILTQTERYLHLMIVDPTQPAITDASCDTKHVAEEAVLFARTGLEEAGIQLHTTLADKLPPAALADVELLWILAGLFAITRNYAFFNDHLDFTVEAGKNKISMQLSSFAPTAFADSFSSLNAEDYDPVPESLKKNHKYSDILALRRFAESRSVSFDIIADQEQGVTLRLDFPSLEATSPH